MSIAKQRKFIEIALLLIAIVQRSSNRFSRIGRETLLKVSGRKRLAPSVMDAIESELFEYGYRVIHVGTSWILIKESSIVSASKAVTAKKWLSAEEKKALAQGLPLDIEALESELGFCDDADVVEDTD